MNGLDCFQYLLRSVNFNLITLSIIMSGRSLVAFFNNNKNLCNRRISCLGDKLMYVCKRLINVVFEEIHEVLYETAVRG